MVGVSRLVGFSGPRESPGILNSCHSGRGVLNDENPAFKQFEQGWQKDKGKK